VWCILYLNCCVLSLYWWAIYDIIYDYKCTECEFIIIIFGHDLQLWWRHNVQWRRLLSWSLIWWSPSTVGVCKSTRTGRVGFGSNFWSGQVWVRVNFMSYGYGSGNKNGLPASPSLNRIDRQIQQQTLSARHFEDHMSWQWVAW